MTSAELERIKHGKNKTWQDIISKWAQYFSQIIKYSLYVTNNPHGTAVDIIEVYLFIEIR